MFRVKGLRVWDLGLRVYGLGCTVHPGAKHPQRLLYLV